MKNKTVKQILKDARKLIAKGWCQSTAARGKSGQSVYCRGRAAVAFCAVGAIARASKNATEAGLARTVLASVLDAPIIYWNDAPRRTKKEVLAAFDRAIKTA